MSEITPSQSRGEEQEPVVVWDAANPMEAQIVKGRLVSEGIPAFIQGEALGEVFGFTTGPLGETTVLVPASVADQAKEILSTDVVWDEETLDDIEAGDVATDEE